MTSGMPELGSKISLISKADIRYEGRLFTVDPQECTIALASVRSFGTEDRETTYPVPAQNQVYDYILFRGSDIKDIRVVNNVPHPQPLNDPAIMQLSVPPSLGGQQYQAHPVLGQIAPQMAQFGGAYGSIGGAIGSLGGALAPGMHMQRDGRGMNNKPNLIGGGSRSTTPASLSSRKSPTADQGTQAGGKRDDKKTVRPIQPPGHQRNQNQQQRTRSRERRDSRGDGQNRQPNRQQNHHGHPGGHHGGHQGNNYHHQNYQNNQHHNQQQQQQGNNGQNRGGNGWTNRGPMRPRGRPRGGYRSNQGQPNQGNKPKNTLKFENDYDFEQANTEFEELRSQLAKVKVDEGSSNTSTKSDVVNGGTVPADGIVANDTEKKDDSGNETGAGEPEHEEDQEIFYDKAKSFFDKISCEAVERAKGKSQRTDWRVERKLNSETFGVSAARRGNYRGRGGYRGMSYRGGYRGGYRQPQRRDQQHQQGQQQSQQQQGNRSASEQTEKTSLDEQNTTSSVQESDKKIVASESETDQNSIPSSSTTEQVLVADPAMAVI